MKERFIDLLWFVLCSLVAAGVIQLCRSFLRFAKTKAFDLIKVDMLSGVLGLASTFLVIWIWSWSSMSIDVCMLLSCLLCILFVLQYSIEKKQSRWATEKLATKLFLAGLLINMKITIALIRQGV